MACEALEMQVAMYEKVLIAVGAVAGLETLALIAIISVFIKSAFVKAGNRVEVSLAYYLNS